MIHRSLPKRFGDGIAPLRRFPSEICVCQLRVTVREYRLSERRSRVFAPSTLMKRARFSNSSLYKVALVESGAGGKEAVEQETLKIKRNFDRLRRVIITLTTT